MVAEAVSIGGGGGGGEGDEGVYSLIESCRPSTCACGLYFLVSSTVKSALPTSRAPQAAKLTALVRFRSGIRNHAATCLASSASRRPPPSAASPPVCAQSPASPKHRYLLKPSARQLEHRLNPSARIAKAALDPADRSNATTEQIHHGSTRLLRRRRRRRLSPARLPASTTAILVRVSPSHYPTPPSTTDPCPAAAATALHPSRCNTAIPRPSSNRSTTSRARRRNIITSIIRSRARAVEAGVSRRALRRCAVVSCARRDASAVRTVASVALSVVKRGEAGRVREMGSGHWRGWLL